MVETVSAEMNKQVAGSRFQGSVAPAAQHAESDAWHLKPGTRHLLLVLLLLAPLPTLATMIVAKDFAGLCDEADMIFVGTVTEVQSRWVDESQRAIETLVTFSDLTSLLGVDGREVTLRFAGGEVDDIREEIAGVPRFTVGDRVLIFARDDRSISPIIGLQQGCFRVVDGPNGPVVEIPEQHPAFAGDDAARAASTLTLDAFVEQVRRELASPQDH